MFEAQLGLGKLGLQLTCVSGKSGSHGGGNAGAPVSFPAASPASGRPVGASGVLASGAPSGGSSISLKSTSNVHPAPDAARASENARERARMNRIVSGPCAS